MVEALCKHAGVAEIRIVVGLSGIATDPVTVRYLVDQPNVRLSVAPPPSSGIFHPKFYRFRAKQDALCWIGSTNLTRGGFSAYAELVYQFSDRNNDGETWFEALWEGWPEDPELLLDRYEIQRIPPPPMNPAIFEEDGVDPADEMPQRADINTWDEFVRGLQTYDRYCHTNGCGSDVLGETLSYLHTIDVGGEVARRSNWKRFTDLDRTVPLDWKGVIPEALGHG